VAYRLVRPALRGFSSRPRGSKQATDRQSGGVLNIGIKWIAVGTLPRPAPRRSSTPPPPQTKKKKIPPAMFACVKRGEKRGRDVRQKENDGERDRDENVGGREGADDEFRPQLINLLYMHIRRLDGRGWMTLDSCRQMLAQ